MSDSQRYPFKHRLIKITDRTLDVVFSRFMCIPFTFTLRQKPKGVTRSRRRTGSLSVELLDRERDPVLRRLVSYQLFYLIYALKLCLFKVTFSFGCSIKWFAHFFSRKNMNKIVRIFTFKVENDDIFQIIDRIKFL